MKTIFIITTILMFFNISFTEGIVNDDKIVLVNKAAIVSVSVTGEENNYRFSVGVSSPDTGCEHYANWWEVISKDGTKLIYRRILGHSHINEQPFVRSGGKVAIKENQIVIVRVHMNNSGYGTKVYKGSVKDGFVASKTTKDFAQELMQKLPLPKGCRS